MATSSMAELIHQLRRTALLRDGAGLTDGQLLEEYISRRDEVALTALVRRHGPMVWGVCRRVLRNHHDVEDAFQATFLVLVRKAASVRPRAMVANWLYGVAHQTAVKARATINTRRGRETQGLGEVPEPAVAEQAQWDDLLALLDEELSRLPENYRAVVVHCDLEGKTRKEVARQLGVPEGTVAGWVARARVMLAKRLGQRGVALSAGGLATILAQNVASAGVPALVVSNTVNAAGLIAEGQAVAAGLIAAQVVALTEGVLKTMLLTKLKTAGAVLLVVALALAVGTAVVSPGLRAFGQADSKTENAPPKAEQPKGDKAKGDKEEIQGTWEVIEEDVNGGQSSTFDKTNPPFWVITADKIEIKKAKSTHKVAYTLDPSKSPKELDITRKDQAGKEETVEYIYKFDKDGHLILCGGRSMLDRPKDFNVERGSGHFLRTLKRQPPVKVEGEPKKETDKPSVKEAPPKPDAPRLGPSQLGLPQLRLPKR